MNVDLKAGLEVLRVILRHSMDNPIKAELIKTMTGVDTREIAEIVRVAAMCGVPIASSSGGYGSWKTREERERYLEREKSRLIALGQKVAAIKKNRNQELTLFEQPS